MKQLRFFIRATLDILQEFLRLLTDWQLSCRSCTSFQIPADFFGVNIAAGEDPECDDYILQRLHELDIKQVRIAFSYHSFDAPAQRLLDRVLAEGFDVLLVLVPPRDQAHAILSDNRVQEQWANFVHKVISCYSDSVKIFEIGGTPNRKKWSGYRLRSYLKAWEIAVQQTQGFSVRLAGPNVQDFEPHANRVLLRAMNRIAAAPAVHTDNLFVERVIEPEAYDHRALGRLVTNQVKLNLIKKARIISRIGQRVGCRQTFSTCFFWTTKRLKRTSLWPQQKKVDYLTRYLVLAASSCALDRVYWGPLICGRDGLIDDGNCDYPEIDHSTFYAEVRGQVEDFKVTPAFTALAFVNQRLKGSKCDTAVSTMTSLHLFSFTGSDGRYFHLCWCRDGQAIRLDDLYSIEQLSEAVFSDACGRPVESPVVINEQVLFVDFPLAEKQVVPAGSATSVYRYRDADVVYLATPLVQSVPWSDQNWRGACTRETASPELSSDDLHPAKLESLPEHDVLRDSRNRLWNIAHPHDPRRLLTVKLNRPTGIKRWSYYFKPSKGLRHWNNASLMLKRGINTPEPIAYYEQLSQSGIRPSYYVCEFVPDAFSSRHVCSAIQQGEEEFQGLSRQQWFDYLAGFICRMHNSGIVHRDLSVGNLMLKRLEDGTITPYLIDIGRARITRKGAAGRHRLLDLMRICYKLDWPNRHLFVQCYNEHWGRSLPSYWRLALGYYDVKQGTKKNLKAGLRKNKKK